MTDVPLDLAPGQILTGVEAVITRKLSHAEGTVLDALKRPVLDATVVVFPIDEGLRGFQSRFIRSARPDQEGRFRLSALPPGDYLAIAVQGLEDGQAGDPEFLAAVEDQAVRDHRRRRDEERDVNRDKDDRFSGNSEFYSLSFS